MPLTQPDFPPPNPAVGGILDRALALVRFLRAHCPWDAAQTPRSLVPYLLEEAHETAEAVARGHEADLADELGDLLLNVAFQVVLAEERGAFAAQDVVNGVEQKMRRRHPHLWGIGPTESWEALKRRERPDRPAGLLDGISAGLDPLLRAHRIQQRVASVGFDWPAPDGALAKVREETDEVAAELGRPDHLSEEIGDLLFSVVNLARLAGADAHLALAAANAKFARRFGALEALAHERDIVVSDAGLELLDELWNEAKRRELSD